ncbi:MAG: ZIP family metal transporter [Candidatus Micrarchaeia archaeon]|jgi:zinc and cadmium transporter
MEALLSLASVAVVSLVSFAGAATLVLNKNSLQKTLLVLVSFSAGALFGDAFLHLIPDLLESSYACAELSVLAGIVLFFVMEKFLRWRHCHVLTSAQHTHPVAFINLVGDATHNFFDGAVIAGSFLASVPLGVATTVAVVLHEIPQELGDFGVLVHAGFKPEKALFYNFLSALTAFAGCVAVLVLGSISPQVSTLLIGVTAGGFIYIAGSDLIPELHKEAPLKKSVVQLAAMLAGMLVMQALLFLE